MEEEEEEGDKKSRKEAGLARRYTNIEHQTPTKITVDLNQSVRPRTIEDLARDSRRILATEKNAGFVIKRGGSRSGGKRVRPSKDKRIQPALTYNSSEDDDDLIINENTGMSDMLLEDEWTIEDEWNKGDDNDDDW